KKVIKQRNHILSNLSLSAELRETYLEPWNWQLASIGSKIILKRLQVLQTFKTHLSEAYQRIATVNLVPTFEYKSLENAQTMNQSEIQPAFLTLMEENKE